MWNEGKHYDVCYLIDSDFELTVPILDIDSGTQIRIILYEYSRRRLNVAFNLKLFLTYYWKNKQAMLQHALNVLEYDRISINRNFPHLDFDQYYNCLRRHLYRLTFSGILK